MNSKKITREDFLPNTTAVPNVVLDWMMADLSPSQFKVLMFFIRQRYGFLLFSGEFEYSIQEIMNGLTTRITKPDGSHEIKKVCAGTGLKKDAVIQAIRDLSNERAIDITRKGNRRITHKFQLGLFDDFKPDDKLLVVKTIQKKTLDGKTYQTLGGKTHQKETVLDGKTVPLRNQEETKLETTVISDSKNSSLPQNSDQEKANQESITPPRPDFLKVFCDFRKKEGTFPEPVIVDGKRIKTKADKDLFGIDARAELAQIKDSAETVRQVLEWAAKDDFWKSQNFIPRNYQSMRKAFLNRKKQSRAIQYAV